MGFVGGGGGTDGSEPVNACCGDGDGDGGGDIDVVVVFVGVGVVGGGIDATESENA